MSKRVNNRIAQDYNRREQQQIYQKLTREGNFIGRERFFLSMTFLKKKRKIRVNMYGRRHKVKYFHSLKETID